MVRRWAIFGLLLLLPLLWGCGSSQTTTIQQFTTPVASPSPSPSPTIVTDNITAIATDAEVASLARGTPVSLRLNRTGTIVEESAATFLSAGPIDGEHRYLCETATPFGNGDAGAPVIATIGGQREVIGALAFILGGGAGQFGVQPATEMINLRTAETPTAAATNPGLTRLLAGLNLRAQELVRTIEPGLLDGYRLVRSSNAATAPVISAQATDPVIGGQSVAIVLVSGDLVESIAVGGITLALPDRLLCFGRQFELNGPSAFPANRALAHGLVGGDDPYKLASASGETLGAVTNDRARGVVVTRGAAGSTYAMTMTVTVGAVTSNFNHRIATDADQSDALSRAVASACLAAARDRIAGGTGRFSITGTRDGQPFSVAETPVESTLDLVLAVVNEIDNQLATIEQAAGPYQEMTITATLDP